MSSGLHVLFANFGTHSPASRTALGTDHAFLIGGLAKWEGPNPQDPYELVTGFALRAERLQPPHPSKRGHR